MPINDEELDGRPVGRPKAPRRSPAEVARAWAVRLAIAAALSALTYGLAILSSWKQGQYGMFADPTRITNRNGVWFVGEAIRQRRAAEGSYPPDLSRASWEGRIPDDFFRDRDVLSDTWGHPLAYAVDDQGFTLTSLGRDGRPGGVGLDADLSYPQPAPEPGPVPFDQFWETMFRPAARTNCLLAAGAVFVLSLVLLRGVDPARPVAWFRRPRRIVMLLALVGAAALVAGYLSFLHLSVNPNH